ncbi:hypothetical protein [Aminobacter sp. DSM 101952]|uniref:hypothetical protein n=1 Tax=Aminobacter sp. DSM 101952 TaxID=2735891 RepID=UPI0012E35A80|nr:hypothetical protein [Aminobacter sp. DSM 101952]
MVDLREASLEDLLGDPIIQAVMASDGVRAEDVRQLMKRISIRTRLHLDISEPIWKPTQRGRLAGSSGLAAG